MMYGKNYIELSTYKYGSPPVFSDIRQVSCQFGGCSAMAWCVESSPIAKREITIFLRNKIIICNCLNDLIDIINKTYVAGKTLVLFHEAFVLLVDLENFAYAVRGRFSLFMEINIFVINLYYKYPGFSNNMYCKCMLCYVVIINLQTFIRSSL